ncbi:hypothetical protein SAMN05444007_11534 [Cribrihabitans marinus]|uniref:Uncharacterized protein n=1 Tax=Cribrihabitans marinus TaxID=1227549 RepID=A0A1H7DVJ8_9RHOB|nr:hypothetical protein [Cribrihabitans marinus]GGH40694.1 hypothetical protein GCM10010973_37220 [Cribrihabitans marinus]SEK05761.1 hypothetical protein SAMN05444007_11534 [Cribrihabitans marinus]
MAERKRSRDGQRESEAFVDTAETPSQQGRAGGNLERKVGTRDLLKRAMQDNPGTTRVRKSDERDDDNS